MMNMGDKVEKGMHVIPMEVDDNDALSFTA